MNMGALVGSAVGRIDGVDNVVSTVGLWLLERAVGAAVGLAVARFVGNAVGLFRGWRVIGDSVKSSVGTGESSLGEIVASGVG